MFKLSLSEANQLRISKTLLRTTLKKCQDEGRLTVGEFGIRITNWEHYQSEYDRQKAWRQKQGKQE